MQFQGIDFRSWFSSRVDNLYVMELWPKRGTFLSTYSYVETRFQRPL